MNRCCDGSDPNLVMDEPPWDPSVAPADRPPTRGSRPCDCGAAFDDVERMVIYPHPRVGGGG